MFATGEICLYTLYGVMLSCFMVIGHRHCMINILKAIKTISWVAIITTMCTKTNYTLLTGHDTSNAEPSLKIHELIFSLDASILCIYIFSIVRHYHVASLLFIFSHFATGMQYLHQKFKFNECMKSNTVCSTFLCIIKNIFKFHPT